MSRYEESLPKVDVFVCTADPKIEPPILVINTVLSVMAYDYPPEKLSVYLSDDGVSELTFYALLEASKFAKHWLPFCKKFKVEPRSPAAYFSVIHQQLHPFHDPLVATELSSIKQMYEDMRNRIEATMQSGQVSTDIHKQHKGFREWDLVSSRNDHAAIVQILFDGREFTTIGVENQLPTLVYLAREKRPQYHHNFKAGAMNALVRVSSQISNGSIILNVDCDMYSNNSESVRDALCFFMDEKKGHEIAYVQYPQAYDNLTSNDLYNICFRVINEVELPAMDSNGGPCYIGSGCFHRRDSLCGMRYSKHYKVDWKKESSICLEKEKQDINALEERCKVQASCTYEENTQWGKEMGVKYGFPVEDIVTGMSIQCRGWKSIYFNPERKGFMGVAPTTLIQILIQQKRWAEGNFLIFLSQYCPFIYGRGKMSLKLQFSYSPYSLWAPNCLPTLYYVVVPPICLLKGIPLFPKVSSLWIIPFLYVIVAKYGYSLAEFLYWGGTLKGWWNEQRMWLFKRTTAYCLALVDVISRLLGITELGFVLTAKVDDNEETYQRYMNEIMEFSSPSLMFYILGTLALLNLFGFIVVLKRMVTGMPNIEDFLDAFALQILLCGMIIVINLPVYQGLFFRKDKGKMPAAVTYKSVVVALLVCSVAMY